MILLAFAISASSLTAAEISWIQSTPTSAPEKVVLKDIEIPGNTDEGEAWKSWLKVYVITTGLPHFTHRPVLGTYTQSEGSITFAPRFPFSDRIAYRAEFAIPLHKSERKDSIVSEWHPDPSAKQPSTLVANIYPTSALLPENLLKFYLTFSNPMSGGHVYDHIHLFNEKDQEVDLPFLELGEELWDESMQRLTLFIDPGRIKRGVKPLEDIGPSLEAGKRYRLVIDKNWKDAEGNPLKSGYEKEFGVTQPDRQPIHPDTWEMIIHSEGSLDALIIQFGESLDYALSQRMIEALNEGQHWIPSTTKLTAEETELHFIPEKPWPKGTHQIRIRTLLEDLAGNNVGKPFEVDVFEEVQKRITVDYVNRTFTIQ